MQVFITGKVIKTFHKMKQYAKSRSMNQSDSKLYMKTAGIIIAMPKRQSPAK